MEIVNTELVLLDKKIIPGETKIIHLNIARLHTMTDLNIPIIVSRSIYDGPTVLLSAGLHGDELTGIEIIRNIIREGINYPACGTIISIPLINVFGFVNQDRNFPDGRDLNRVFPGSINGSLASRFAYRLMEDIIPHVDYVIDYHAGGRSRFNVPQIRIEPKNKELFSLAEAFSAPFLLYSSNISGSFREACDLTKVKYLLFEGGKAMNVDASVIQAGVQGTVRFLAHLRMLNSKFSAQVPKHPMIRITNSVWIRAQYSGMFHNFVKNGTFVKKGEELGKITDPYGSIEEAVLAPNNGYIICINEAAIVFQGDAVYHISTMLE